MYCRMTELIVTGIVQDYDMSDKTVHDLRQVGDCSYSNSRQAGLRSTLGQCGELGCQGYPAGMPLTCRLSRAIAEAPSGVPGGRARALATSAVVQLRNSTHAQAGEASLALFKPSRR